jgi:fused signal recognition particle receptor
MSETMTALESMLEGKKAQEQIAAQVEAQRIENERIANELAAKQKEEEDRQREVLKAEAERQRAQAEDISKQRAELEAMQRKIDAHNAEEEAKARAKIQAEQLAMEQEKAAKPHPDSVVKESLTTETPEEKALRLENYEIWQGMPKQSRPTRIQMIESLAKVYSVKYSIAEQWLVEEFSKEIK